MVQKSWNLEDQTKESKTVKFFVIEVEKYISE